MPPKDRLREGGRERGQKTLIYVVINCWQQPPARPLTLCRFITNCIRIASLGARDKTWAEAISLAWAVTSQVVPRVESIILALGFITLRWAANRRRMPLGRQAQACDIMTVEKLALIQSPRLRPAPRCTKSLLLQFFRRMLRALGMVAGVPSSEIVPSTICCPSQLRLADERLGRKR
jgi:hypothetical protein